MQAVAIVGEDNQPGEAARVAPWDGSVLAHFAKAAYSSRLAATAGNVTRPPEWVGRLALEAYERQPLTPEALAVIGAGLPQNRKASFWDAAADISRRDTLLQGLLLKFHLQTGRLDASIHVLKQILQIRASERRAAYGALGQALRDRRSVETFADILRDDPEWGDSFLVTAARDKEALPNLALLRQQLPTAVVDAATDRTLVHAFAKAGQLDLAYHLYARLSSQRSGQTNAWSSEIPPFDWSFADEPGFRAQAFGESEQLSLNIARGKGGVLASRILPARSRTLTIRGQHALKPPGQADRLEIALACLGAEGNFAQTTFTGGRIALSAAVPPNCGYVELTLSGRAWSEGERIVGTVSPLTITAED